MKSKVAAKFNINENNFIEVRTLAALSLLNNFDEILTVYEKEKTRKKEEIGKGSAREDHAGLSAQLNAAYTKDKPA